MTFVKGTIPWNKGKTYSNQNKGKKLSEAHRLALMVPRPGAGKYERTDYHKSITSEATKRQYEQGTALGFRGKKYYGIGEKNHNWKGGITPINEKIRRSVEYKLWRRAVFERDKYTCVICFTKGGDLQADHIKPFAHYPKLRFELSNGRTLCKLCHRQTDTYGAKSKLK
jgi:hypothetical protein